ncbi:hypothetical protein E5S67_05963 [Microcoleus sp. IPMA8]|uniref:Uncharacterized protein n=1 Tax=Microcoleus asticus IPMA8 TaxID=2563858 RepID=A0ABX2D7Q2_9CYAN|nr:hypothetical protein [Microcoleus asticus IPMA8]
MKIITAGKNLKPYQGLKHSSHSIQSWGSAIAGKNLKPYQGLKRPFLPRKPSAKIKPEKT